MAASPRAASIAVDAAADGRPPFQYTVIAFVCAEIAMPV